MEGKCDLDSVVVLGDSSVASTVSWRALCLVRIFSLGNNCLKCLGGQALDCTPDMRGDMSRSDCDLLWFSLCPNYMGEEAENNLELCTERSDRNERRKNLEYLLQSSLDFCAVTNLLFCGSCYCRDCHTRLFRCPSKSFVCCHCSHWQDLCKSSQKKQSLRIDSTEWLLFYSCSIYIIITPNLLRHSKAYSKPHTHRSVG